MEIWEVVIIGILGSDIMESDYCDVNDCALAKATKRHFGTDNVSAGSRTISVGNKDFFIDDVNFNPKTFNQLKETLTDKQLNDIVIKVKLTFYKILY